MAIPSYTTDLTTFNDATTNTGWGEFTGMALGAGPDIDSDLAIHGSICITQDRAKVGLNSQGYDGTAVTINTGECFFIWTKFFAPNSLDTLALGGQMVVVGTSLSVWDAWYMDGNDTYDYGGWKNYAVDPTFASDSNAGTVTTYNACGNAWNLVTAPQKGNPFNTDIIRYGRGESIFTGGETANYATFAGYAVVNDNPTTGRFGLIQAEGLGYLYKGLMSLGTAGTAVDMRDSNTSITIDDTTKTLATFNRIEVNNASSNIEWTSISFGALGTNSKGQFEAIDNATITKTACTFTDMDSFTYQSNSTLDVCTFRRCGIVTMGGCTITNSTFDTATGTSSVNTADLEILTDCTFNSDGSNHAVELTALGNGTMNWNNYLTDYAVADGSTGNEAIYVNVATGTLTINVGAGYTIPYIRTAGAVVTVVAGQVTTTITVKNQDGDPIVGARVYAITESTGTYPTPPETDGTLIFNTLTDVNGQVSDTRSLGSPQPITGWARDSTAPPPYYKQTPLAEVIDNGTGLNLNMLLILDE